MKKITNFIIAILAAVGSFIPVGGVYAASNTDSWGPQDRDTFTWAAPSDHVTFNSITDNPEIGDERNFVRIREADTGDHFLDSVDVEPGKTYEVYVYFHNNASASLNASGVGIADNVRLATKLPEKIEAGKIGVVYGTVSSTNAKPTSVWDTAYLKATETVYMRYVWDSATIHSRGNADGEVLNADALFSEEGAKVAFASTNARGDSLWGMVPGCNDYAFYVTYKVTADQPKFGINKEVSAEGANTYNDNISTAPGSTLDFKISYKNMGTTEQKSVTVYDAMPEGMSYVKGTTFVTTTDNPSGTFMSDGLFDGGIIIGDFDPGEEATITYKATVDADKSKFRCGENVIYNDVSVATANGTLSDKARITVVKVCETSSLPETGPAEIIMAVIIVLVICGGGYYFYRSSKMLRKVTKSAEGEDDIVKDGISGE